MMAEYKDVIKQFKRMCKSVSSAQCTRGECLMGCENIGQCRKVAFERPAEFEERVMAWAAEHPEPVYPTWYAWLANMCVVPIELPPDQAVMVTDIGLLKKIPADIAQKLGIEPKK